MKRLLQFVLAGVLLPVISNAAPGIVGVQSAAPGVIDLVLSSTNSEPGDGTVVPDVIDTSPASYRVDGVQPIAVSRYSLPFDETPADTAVSPNRYGVTVRHHIFLRVPGPLQDGSTHAVTSPYGSSSLTYTDTGTYCSAIQVNQGAYSALATSRYGIFSVWLGDGGTSRLNPLPSYRVYAENSGTLLLSGAASLETDDTGTGVRSGTWAYRLSLTSLSTGGPFFISVPGCGRSRSFWVGGQAFKDTAFTVFRGLYHQRCSCSLDAQYTQWTRPTCSLTHRQMPDVRQTWSATTNIVVPAGTPTISVGYGHHDAGDFDRRPQHIIIPVELLTYAEAFPQNFYAGQFNIPGEPANGPDILKEAMWATRSWETLQVTNQSDPQYGGIRAGSGETRHPTFGVDYAATDPVVYATWSVDGPAGSSAEGITAFAAGVFAQASRLVRPYDSARAATLLNEATLAWAYVARTYDLSQTKTYLMYGALQMYLTTGQQSFHDLFKRQAQAIVTVPPGGGTWPEQWASSNIVANCKAAHFISYVLPQSQPVDGAVVDAIKARVIREADSGGYFAVRPESTAFPILSASFLDWGTTNTIRFDAAQFAWVVTTDPAKKQGYYNTISLMADHILGLNAMGRPFITGIGTDRLVSPLHADSYFTELRGLGPVGGITLYGVTGGRSGAGYQVAVTGKLSPGWDALPIMRHWADGWSAVGQNEFTTWESIIWNAVAFGFLSGPQGTVPPPPLDGGVIIPDASVDVVADRVSADAPDVPLVDASADVLVVQDVPAPVDVVPPRDSGSADASLDAGIVCIEVTAPVCWRPMSMPQ